MRSFAQLSADFLLRTLLGGVLFVAFSLLDWGLAVKLTAYTATTALSSLCQHMATAVAGRVELICDGHVFAVTKECTYIELFLITAPFIWRARQSSVVNLRRLLFVFCLIWFLNAIRMVGGLFLSVQGVSWQLAHDIPDWLLYGSILGVALLIYSRHATDAYLCTPRRSPSP